MKKPAFHLHYPRVTAIFVLTILIFCLYSVSLGHNFLFDEDNIILLNPLLRDLSNFPKLFQVGFFQRFAPGSSVLWNDYYRPLTLVSFALDWQIWGSNPLGYNLVNTALHLTVCALLFLLLHRITKHIGAAFLGALLFGVHTIHTEAVTYIASRSDLFGGLFVMAALLLYWRGRMAPVYALYALAPFAKESGLLLPVYLFILDFCFVRTKLRDLVRRFAGFAVIGLAYIVFRKYGTEIPLGPGSISSHGGLLRFLSMGPPFISYLQVLLAPEAFRYCDGISFAKSFTDHQVLVTAQILAVLGAAWFAALRYRGSVLFGLSIFLFAYFPSLQIIHYYPEWAEHYLYIPLIGLIIMLSTLFKNILEQKKAFWVGLLFLIYVPFTAFVSFRTVQRNLLYNDAEKFCTALSRSPSPYSYYGYINLARFLCEKGKWEEAYVPLKTALLIEPESEANHYNMALYHTYKKNYAKAHEFFRKAYDIGSPQQPIYLLNSVIALNRLEKYQEAIDELETVYPKVKNEWTVYKNFMRSYEFMGNPKKALEWGNIGIQETSSDVSRQAAVMVEIVSLAYRQGWDDVLTEYLDQMIQKFPDMPWYADLAFFLKGKVSVEAYEKLVAEKYWPSIKESRHYVLMAYVLRKDRAGAQSYLDRYRSEIEKNSNDEVLVNRMFARAERFLASHPAN